MLLRPLFLACALALPLLLAAGGGAEAQSQGRKSAPPRADVENQPGRYYQLQMLWIPVEIGTPSRPRINYIGIVVRLWPLPDKRYEACLQVPWLNERILAWFNDNPPDRRTFENRYQLNQMIFDVVQANTPERLFEKSETFYEFVAPDVESDIVSRACQ